MVGRLSLTVGKLWSATATENTPDCIPMDRPLAFNTTGEYEKASAYSMPENAYGTYRWHPVDGCAIRLSGLGECRCRGP